MKFRIHVEFEYEITTDEYININEEALAICEENNVFENYDNIVDLQWRREPDDDISYVPENIIIDDEEDTEDEEEIFN